MGKVKLLNTAKQAPQISTGNHFGEKHQNQKL